MSKENEIKHMCPEDVVGYISACTGRMARVQAGREHGTAPQNLVGLAREFPSQAPQPFVSWVTECRHGQRAS